MTSITDLVPDSHQPLIKARLTAALTTVDGKGRPQSTAIWYLVDEDGLLKGSTTSDRQKYKNLMANPYCSLFITDPENSYRTLEVRAEAELAPDPDKVTVRKFAKAYGVDESMLLAHPEERWTLTFRPYRVVAAPAGG